MSIRWSLSVLQFVQQKPTSSLPIPPLSVINEHSLTPKQLLLAIHQEIICHVLLDYHRNRKKATIDDRIIYKYY